jgi:hypothetical protein
MRLPPKKAGLHSARPSSEIMTVGGSPPLIIYIIFSGTFERKRGFRV